MNVQWLVNGASGGSLDPGDRGLAYGDGLFETMAVRGGGVPRLTYHFDRLVEGCERLGMPKPDLDLLTSEVRRQARGIERGVVKLIVTRGTGGRGYAPPAHPELTRIIGIFPWPERDASHYTKGLVLASSGVPVAENARLAGLKTLGRLEQVLARMEMPAGADEALVKRAGGEIVGGTISNVFVVRTGRVSTPAVATCGVRGVMRRIVMETCARQGARVEETDLLDADLHAADEIFVTNAVAGVRPVREYAGRMFSVGPVTRRLQEAVNDD